jgi:A/G-specific adenine glycosylase
MAGKKILKFQNKVLTYYQKNKRDLLFRETTDPYAILLSEIMLQQTQVERGLKYYSRWLQKWPTIHDLAKASRVDILKEWMGLGYNNRAKNLHETAKIISEKYEGDVLKALPHYKELPGIGPYTSAAVQIFAANRDIVTVDTNIRRIFIHEFKLSEKLSDKELWAIAQECLPKGKSRDWHNALMDYGATLLTSRKTGIRPKTRQSKFEGSDRQIRAKILRLLLEDPKKEWTMKNLFAYVPKPMDERRLRGIVATLSDDALIELKKGRIALK